MPRRMLVLTALFPPAFRGGGPIRTLEALVLSSPREYEPVVITSDRDLGSHSRLPVRSNTWTEYHGKKIIYISADKIKYLFQGIHAGQNIRPEAVYLNSLFNLRFGIFPLALGRVGFWRRASILLAPRGELAAGALGHHTVRKLLAVAAMRGLGFFRGVTWHASSSLEAEDIRRLMGTGSCIVIHEDDTLLPLKATVHKNGRSPNDCGRLRLVYLSRITEHKGLHILLHALKEISQPIDVYIYGPSEDLSYVNQCKRLASASHHKIYWGGEVAPEEVSSVFSQADLMVLPTRSENFGHVIAEALSVGCPVLTSDQTPWTPILESGGGWVCQRNVGDFVESIRSYVSLGRSTWDANRDRVADVYDRWRANKLDKHVFELFLERRS